MHILCYLSSVFSEIRLVLEKSKIANRTNNVHIPVHIEMAALRSP
jgi:hypothetical protein